jgi:ribonuclease HI
VDPLSAAAPALAVTKNNRIKLAVIEAPGAQRPAKVTLGTDSKYLLDGTTNWIRGWQLNGWKTAARKPVKDDDLWRGLADAMSRHDVTVGWVKGRAGDPGNERAGALARHRRARHHGRFRPGDLSGACVIRNAARR